MKTIAIISRKGGAGKSTIAVHLAVAAEKIGLSSAIFDLDPQASSVIWSDNRGDKFPAVVPAQAPRLPSLMSQAYDNDADLILLDTPSVLDNAASSAADEADLILIPCRPSAFDLSSIDASVRMARSVNKPAAVVITMAKARGLEVQEAITAITASGVEVCPVILHDLKDFSRGIQAGRTAQEVAPQGKAAGEVRDLLLWVCDKIASQQANMSTNEHARARA